MGFHCLFNDGLGLCMAIMVYICIGLGIGTYFYMTIYSKVILYEPQEVPSPLTDKFDLS